MKSDMQTKTRVRWSEILALCLLNGIFFWALLTKTGYFYLDTATVIEIAQNVFRDPKVLYAVYGRFCPSVYVFFALWGGVFGFAPQALLAGQFLLVAAAFTLLFLWMTRRGFPQLIKWCLLFFLYFQQLTAENLMTLGKSEVFLSAFAVCAVLLLYRLLSRPLGRAGRGWTLGGLFVSFFLFFCAKETSLTVLAFFLALFLLGRSYLREGWQKRAILWALGMAGAACLLFLLLRALSPTPAGGYVQMHGSIPLAIANLRTYIGQVPDLFVFALLSSGVWIARWLRERMTPVACLGAALCVWGYAYVGAMLFWRFTLSYYLYFPSTLFLLSLLLLCHDVGASWAALSGRRGRGVRALVATCAALVLLVQGQYAYYVGATHSDLEGAYTSSLESLSGLLSGGEVLYYQDGSGEAEPPIATSRYFNNLKGQELTVIGLGASYGEGPEAGRQEAWRAENPQPGDYVVVYDNLRTSPVQIRATSPGEALGLEEGLLKKGVQMRQLSGEQTRRRLPNGWIFAPGRIETVSGFRIYQVDRAGNPARLEGLMSDGWTGREFWIRGTSSAKIGLRLNPVSFQFFDYNELTLTLKGQMVARIPLPAGTELVDLSPYLPEPAPGETMDVLCAVGVTTADLPSPPQGDPRELGIYPALEFFGEAQP